MLDLINLPSNFGGYPMVKKKPNLIIGGFLLEPLAARWRAAWLVLFFLSILNPSQEKPFLLPITKSTKMKLF